MLANRNIFCYNAIRGRLIEMPTKNQDYKNLNYDRLAIWIKKGSRDNYKQSAAKFGISLAMLVQNGVEEYIRNHGGEVVVPTARQETETISAEERRLIQAFGNCPDNMKPTLRKLIDQLAQTKGGD